MKRSRILFLIAVLLVLAAGVVMGRLSAFLPKHAAEIDNDHDRLWAELNLTPEQHKQIDAIRADLKSNVDKTFEKRAAAEKARDQAIFNLLTTHQRVAYDKIMSDYKAVAAETEKERAQLFQDVATKTRSLLDDQQKEKWDSILKQRHEGHGRHSSSRRSTTLPATRPDMRNN